MHGDVLQLSTIAADCILREIYCVVSLVMAALRSRCGHYIFVLWFLLLIFSSPNLSRRRLDVYHTSTHGVALVRIWNAGLKCAAGGSLRLGDIQSAAAEIR